MYKIIKKAALDTTPVMLEIKNKVIFSEKQQLKKAKSALDEAKHQAEAIIKLAKEQADDLIAIARTEGAEIKDMAEKQGYQSGLERAETAATEIRQQAQAVLHQAEIVRRETLAEMESEIISLAVEIAEKVLGTQLELDQDLIIKAALTAIKLVKERERVTFYVNPDDIGIYIAHKQELEKVLSERALLTFTADANIKPGGCLVDTEQGLVDATIDERWKQVLQAVKGEEQGSRNEDQG
ncbi:MAG: hypothetical protein LRZ99_03310 [Desulfotomaculum sp.]|nr:hypothetical protein [Desulfotomaculum sp.]MCL0080853.1 FliH/SctL family protein [Peptococcaceae bacterium]